MKQTDTVHSTALDEKELVFYPVLAITVKDFGSEFERQVSYLSYLLPTLTEKKSRFYQLYLKNAFGKALDATLLYFVNIRLLTDRCHRSDM